MSTELRVYPYPYIDFRLEPNHLLHIAENANKLSKAFPDLRNSQITAMKDRMAVAIAFADVYGKQEEFLNTVPEEYRYPRFCDFRHGPKQIKLVAGRVNEKLERTGISTMFKVPANILRQSKASYYILAAFHMPHVQFVGWLEPADMQSFVRGWSCTVFAGCPKLKPMMDLSLEDHRQKGCYV